MGAASGVPANGRTRSTVTEGGREGGSKSPCKHPSAIRQVSRRSFTQFPRTNQKKAAADGNRISGSLCPTRKGWCVLKRWRRGRKSFVFQRLSVQSIPVSKTQKRYKLRLIIQYSIIIMSRPILVIYFQSHSGCFQSFPLCQEQYIQGRPAHKSITDLCIK